MARRPFVLSLAEMPTGRGGRILAAALALFVLAVLYLVVAAPLWNFYAEQASTIERRQMLLPRLNALAAEVPQLRARVAALNAAARARKVTLDGTTDAIAAASLENRVDQLASSLGIHVASSESLPPENKGDYRRIGLRLTLNAPYEELVKLIAALEAAVPPLVIGHLQFQGVAVFRPGPTRDLSAGLDVYGFREKTPPAGRS